MIMQSLAVPTIILLVAMITDIKTRKVYNKWVIASIFLAMLSSYAFYDFEGLRQGAVAAGLAIVMTLPLVLIGMLGAGDMKILFAFGLATTYQTVFSVVILSFIWAAIIGLLFALKDGKVQQLASNTVGLLMAQKVERKDLQKIPYTVPIFASWISFIAIGFYKGAII